MKKKLTLTIDKKIINIAKIYAKEKGKSLSGIVENYLRVITIEERKQEVLSPVITNLIGIIKLPEDFNYKNELHIAIANKYKKRRRK